MCFPNQRAFVLILSAAVFIAAARLGHAQEGVQPRGVPIDCNSNGIDDAIDIADCPPGDPDCTDCNSNGVPDGCELAENDCNANGVFDACDVDPADPDGDKAVSDDCNGNGIPDECELPGRALRFDGVNDFARVSSPSALPLGNAPRTVELWLRRNSSDTEMGIFVYGSYAACNQFGLVLTPNCPNKLGFYGWGGACDLCSTNNVPVGQWTHVAATYDGSVLRLYMNGALEASANRTLNTVLNPSGLLIGTRNDINETWNGDIDEFRVWNYARSQAKIQADMSRRLTGTETGLVGYWSFQETGGQVIFDRSPSRMNGTLGASSSPASDDPTRVTTAAPLTGMDCNANGIPDECDIAASFSQDCNANGVPDECDIARSNPATVRDGSLGSTKASTSSGSANIVIDVSLGKVGNGSAVARPWEQRPPPKPNALGRDESGGAAGEFNPRGSCVGDCPPGATVENEPNCGIPTDTVNGGCNSSPAVFTPIRCGETICGTSAYNGMIRDTDWFEITTATDAIFTWTVEAEFDALIGLAETVPPGAGDCADYTGFINPAVFPKSCTVGSVTTACLPAGTYWFFVAPQFLSTEPCGAEYRATLTCEAGCDGPDCNDNGIPDECDLMGNDCNDNGIPDDCELDGNDCNSNGVLDACDLDPADPDGDKAVSEDCNSNGVPDECDIVGQAMAIAQQAYLKASNTGAVDAFGFSVAVSGDTVVVGASQESSNATGVNGNQADNSASFAGAAYVFVRDAGGVWSQQAYLKASNTEGTVFFGNSVAISGDTVVVGAPLERSNATGVNGNQADNSASAAGAAYVFVRNCGVWTQQAYLKASNTQAFDQFATSVAISGDTVVIGALHESSNATGVNGNQADNSAMESGAVYVFLRVGGVWTQQAYLKASNTGTGDHFGTSVAVSGDTVVVGASDEDSSASGVNGNQANNSASQSGAAYVFARSGGVWSQQAYLKASNTGANDSFGDPVAVSGDTVVVGAPLEDSSAAGVNGNGADNSVTDAGAAYVFARSGIIWNQQAYIKASNTGGGDGFGTSVALSGDTVAVGSYRESSNATGVNGNQADNSAIESGAAYVFLRVGGVWSQQAYLKASNTGANDWFGFSVAVSGDTVVVGAHREDSIATGVNGNQASNSADGSGAAYVFSFPSSSSDCNANGIPDDCESAPAGVLLVNVARQGAVASDGLTWGTAYRHLQDALTAAAGSGGAITQIWVAAGTYGPDETAANPGGTCSRTATFTLQNNLAIYGGFACGDDELSDRDPENNLTILSGDLSGDDGPDFVNYGENSYHVVTGSGVASSAVLDGFTISGGNADAGNPNDRGAGMLNNGGSATVTNCQFINNKASNGGAIRNDFGAGPSFTNCGFVGNRANSGGAIHNTGTSPVISGCHFSGNTATGFNGGGIMNQNGAGPQISGCWFEGNSAVRGGAIANWTDAGQPSNAVITDCTFENNTAQNGAAIRNDASHPAISGCTFEDNTSVGSGGAISSDASNFTLTDCTLTGNESQTSAGGAIQLANGGTPLLNRCRFFGNACATDGGAIEISLGAQLTARQCIYSGNSAGLHGGAINMRACAGNCAATVRHSTFSGNDATYGGAFHNDQGTLNVSNSILWGNTPQQFLKSTNGVSNTFSYCDVAGLDEWLAGGICNPISCENCTAFCGDGPLTLGPGNIDADPAFLDPDGADNMIGTADDDLHIPVWSLCADTGDPAFVPQPGETDIDGDDRVLGCRVDMGADEAVTGAANTGDMDGSGTTDIVDLPLFVNALLYASPNCAADMNIDGVADGLDVQDFTEELIGP